MLKYFEDILNLKFKGSPYIYTYVEKERKKIESW